MDKTGSRFKIYVAVVFLTGLLLLGSTTKDLEGFEGRFESPVDFMLWMVMLTIVVLSPIPRSGGRSTVVLTPALDMAAILLFGTGIASWFGVFSRLIANTSERWAPISRSVLKLGQSVVAIAAAGSVYLTLGGHVGPGLFQDGSQILVALAAAAVYLLINSGVGAVGAHLANQRLQAFEWSREVRHRVVNDALTLPFGVLLALTQVLVGPVGVALFLVPLLLARYIYKLWLEMKRAHLETVRMLMGAMDALSPGTRGHSYRVSRMCVTVGRHLQMTENEIEQLEYASLLHDIGRTAMAHELTNKAGKLTEKEHSIVRAHPRVGAEVLRRIPFFQEAAEIVHAHHEQPDGNGYPRGLALGRIPMGSRIIGVVAAFDAMTSDRPYRMGLSPDAAFEELLAHSGTQFTTEVVEALIELYSTGALFQDFDDEELQRYAEGQYSSRALEKFVKGRRNAEVPEKVYRSDPPAGVPIIEMPAPSDTRFVENEYEMASGQRVLVAGASDVGCVRSNNEDSFGVFKGEREERGVLLVLADGMGGEAAGEIASAMAVDAVRGVYFDGSPDPDPPEALERAIQLANRAIYARATSTSDLEGMGTTCTAAAILGTEMIIGHIGDSRAYLVAGGEITLLTRDHTLAAELNEMTGSDLSMGAGASNVLTRCLGSNPDVEVDEIPEPISLESGDVIVLCSDGLSNMVDAAEIQTLATDLSPAEACRRLVEIARERGAPDNVTVTVARLAA